MAFFDPLTTAVARRPALPAAVVFILGVGSYRLVSFNPVALLVGIAGLIGLAIALFRFARVSSGVIALAILLCGACAGRLAEYYFPGNEIGLFAGSEPRLAWVEGVVAETPRVVESPPLGRKLPDKQFLTLDVRAVRTGAGWSAARGQMPLTISPPRAGLSPGQTVRVLGQLGRPGPAMNPGGFDAAGFYRRRRVLAVMRVSRPYDVQILATGSRVSVLSVLRDGSRDLLGRGFPPERTGDLDLLKALVFGDRGPALRNTVEDFVHAGLSHVLASNGTRIALLAAIIYVACRLLRLSPRRTLGAVTGGVAVFGFLTLPAAEAIRPAIVCAAVGAGWMSRRAVDPLQILSVAALALLAPRPLDRYSAGFQLSFVIVTGMILFTGPTLRLLGRLEDPDKRVARSFVRQSGWRRAAGWLGRWVMQAAVAGLVAWVMAIPLAIYHFEQFNTWTVPFGILLSPLAVVVLLGGFAKIILTAVCPPLAWVWAALAGIPASALRHGVHVLAHVPACDLPITRPPAWQIVLYYALLSAPLIHWPRRPVRWCARLAPIGASVWLVVLPLVGGFGSQRALPGGVRITLMAVGAGQCAVVEPAGGGVVLIDAGSSTISDPMRECFEPFLRHEGCRSIDQIWLSHGDFDHISAARDLVPEYGVREVLTSPLFRKHAAESKPCAALLSMLERLHHSPRLVAAGDRVRIGSDAELRVLWPPADCTFNSNNAGLVLRLTCRGTSVLFPADIQEPAERELLKHPELLRSDVLIAPHHGSSESTTSRFVAAVSPKYILASSDFRLTQKQRTFDADVAGRPLYRTGRCGAITIDVDRDGTLRIVTCLSAYGR